MIDKTNSLPPKILAIVRDKGTERPFTSKELSSQPGTYLCRQCGLALYRTPMQFPSGCGWPSFDDEIDATVKQKPDADGHRTEILCKRCNAHLGHVFLGENFTQKNTRHCVNSASLDYVKNTDVLDSEEGIFAAGCFWGVEYYFQKLKGVLKTEVGYTGGGQSNPTYREVCNQSTGHYEALRVVYDPSIIDYASIVKFFFEIHDPTQANGQGPDIGPQYLSAIFYYDDAQKTQAEKFKKELETKGLPIATKILPVSIFWSAEEYHQDYYNKNRHEPYCHRYTKRF